MAGSGSSERLEAALDELYGAELSEFVATRKRLAGELRAAGDKDAAKALVAARRPTTAVWALNQMSRREPGLVESLLERSRELHDAQTRAAGGREEIRDVTRAHRGALADATDAALAALGPRATDGYRAQIAATLHAASVDDATGELLRSGRLIREVQGVTGFPEGPGLTLVPDLPPPAAPVPTAKKPPSAKRDTEGEEAAAGKSRQAEADRVERERAAAEELARRRAEADAAWQVARDEVAVAESAARERYEQVDRLEAELDQARRDAHDAEERAAGARREAARLARAAMKLQS